MLIKVAIPNQIQLKLIPNLSAILTGKQNDVHYIGGAEVLPAPLEAEAEAKAIRELGTEEGGAARSLLIEHNLRLVVYIAKKFDNTGVGVEDLISIGTIGLIKAINTFNSGKNIKLATYASRCIENEILMYLRAGKKYKNDLSLTSPVGTDKDGNELSFMDLLFEKEEDVFDKTERDVMGEKFNKTIRSILKEREYEIIRLRYGLNGCIPLTQWETAKRLGISRSYVSRIEKRAIKTLRDTLRREDYLE